MKLRNKDWFIHFYPKNNIFSKKMYYKADFESYNGLVYWNIGIISIGYWKG